MKNIKIIVLMLIALMIITWCSEDKIETSKLEKNEVEKVSVPVIENEEDKIENEIYNEIVEEKGSLKDVTSEDLDKIIQEEIKILNTPISDYPFFEQYSIKKWDIQEIKKAWWMEVTRWQIYLLWLDEKYSFLNDILSEEEKEYSFHKENEEFNFFYTELSEDDFLKNLKNNYWEYKKIFSDSEFREIGFINNNIEYSMQIVFSKEYSPRDELDNILETINKIKVIINSLN